jgi:myo-inositol-1(or 4)-monophosphatase
MGQLDDIRTLMDGYDDMRSLGTAAYALFLAADGGLASFVEIDLFVHDWAAGALIADEAGARVTVRKGCSVDQSARAAETKHDQN